MIHLFINTNSSYNCWFYTSVYVLLNKIFDIKTCTKIKGHVLVKYLLNYAYCELFLEGNIYICLITHSMVQSPS